MNYLTELESSPAIRPISVREYIENPLQPPFPFPFHRKRDGEPRYPRVIKSTMSQSELAETSADTIAWHKWSWKQPDFVLLYQERNLFEQMQNTQVPLPDDELDTIKSRLILEATKLRNTGHGELVDRFWPHLPSFEST